MIYEFHLPEQVDGKLLSRAMRMRPRTQIGGLLKYGAFALSLGRGGLFAMGGIVLAFMVLRAFDTTQNFQVLAAFLLGTLLTIAILFLSWHLARILQVRRILCSPIYSGKTDFSLSPEGLGMRATHVNWNVSWPAIENVIDDRDGLFFYSGVFTYVLPKRVLGGTDVKDILASVEGWRHPEAAT